MEDFVGTLPLHIGRGPLRRLNWIDIQRAVVCWELGIAPHLLRVLYHLLDLLHLHVDLLLFGLLNILFLLELLSVVLLVIFVAVVLVLLAMGTILVAIKRAQKVSCAELT